MSDDELKENGTKGLLYVSKGLLYVCLFVYIYIYIFWDVVTVYALCSCWKLGGEKKNNGNGHICYFTLALCPRDVWVNQD